MKHQTLIDKFRARKDENDGYCDIIWLPASPSGKFNNVLPAPRTDILAAYMDIADGFELSFFTSSPDDREQGFVKLGELPFSVQKMVYNYIFK